MWRSPFALAMLALVLGGCVAEKATPSTSPSGTTTTTPQQTTAPSPTTSTPPPTQPTQGSNGSSAPLRIVLSDVGFPEVKFLEPTLRSIDLQKQEGEWVTIWSSASGQSVRLTPNGTPFVLASARVPAGTFVAARLHATSIGVLLDANRDGDTTDSNVEIVLTEDEFAQLPPQDKPNEPQPPPTPTPPTGPPTSPTNGSGTQPTQPSPPTPPTAPTGPPGVRHENGLVYMGHFVNESDVVLPPFWDGVRVGDYLAPVWRAPLAYDGGGGTLTFDFTLDPFQPKDRQILVDASYER